MLKKFEIAGDAVIPSEREDCAIRLYIAPTDEEKGWIMRETGIDEHALASALDPDEVSRVEFHTRFTFLVWKQAMTALPTEGVLFNVSSAGAILGSDRLVLILSEDVPLFEDRIFRSVRTLADVLLRFVLHSIHHYLAHLRVIKQISREIQKKLATSIGNQYLIQMFTLGESLIYYLNAIGANGSVLAKLRARAERLGLPSEEIFFLDDVLIENDQCYKQAEIHSEVLAGLMDARGNLINNNMNVLLKNLTVINIVFLPLNLLASIGGMSEYSAITHGIDWRISYGLFFVGMAALGWLTLVAVNRIDWQSAEVLEIGRRRKSRPGSSRD